jgi:hypothetical protein
VWVTMLFVNSVTLCGGATWVDVGLTRLTTVPPVHRHAENKHWSCVTRFAWRRHCCRWVPRLRMGMEI